MPVELDLSGPEQQLQKLGAAVRKEVDGTTMRKELVSNIRTALGPARQAARTNIKSMPSQGHAGRKLRSAVAQKILVEARPTGKSVGAKVVAAKTKNLRGFANAPKRLNAKSFRHPVFGNRSKWVAQVGKPGWFDDAMAGQRAAYRKAVQDAMETTAKKLSRSI